MLDNRFDAMLDILREISANNYRGALITDDRFASVFSFSCPSSLSLLFFYVLFSGSLIFSSPVIPSFRLVLPSAEWIGRLVVRWVVRGT